MIDDVQVLGLYIRVAYKYPGIKQNILYFSQILFYHFQNTLLRDWHIYSIDSAIVWQILWNAFSGILWRSAVAFLIISKSLAFPGFFFFVVVFPDWGTPRSHTVTRGENKEPDEQVLFSYWPGKDVLYIWNGRVICAYTLRINKSSVKMACTWSSTYSPVGNNFLNCYTAFFHDYSPGLLNRLIVSACRRLPWTYLTCRWCAVEILLVLQRLAESFGWFQLDYY